MSERNKTLQSNALKLGNLKSYRVSLQIIRKSAFFGVNFRVDDGHKIFGKQIENLSSQ